MQNLADMQVLAKSQYSRIGLWNVPLVPVIANLRRHVVISHIGGVIAGLVDDDVMVILSRGVLLPVDGAVTLTLA